MIRSMMMMKAFICLVSGHIWYRRVSAGCVTYSCDRCGTPTDVCTYLKQRVKLIERQREVGK